MLINRLKDETSPYLLQHADNPVAWQPWDTQALEEAKAQDKPILLSIGYSACHWCHVMAHESFADPKTAKIMNQLFINIKVDREERPDLDKIYQTAHQLLTQRPGGWPLTVFLDPQDHTPFFAGTYFPPTARYHLPAFTEVLTKLAHFFASQRAEIRQQNSQVKQVLARINSSSTQADTELVATPIQAALLHFEQKFDWQYGGFSGAPKFPQPGMLNYLLMVSSANPDRAAQQKAQAMLRMTLLHIARGGIYDQLGGGFYRYAVDERWEIPHFEKMLYDQGQLLALYASAAKLLDEPELAEICRQSAAWIMAVMQSPEGGYYASLDADSAGKEGLYYYWEREQIKNLLRTNELDLVSAVFNLNQPPNFEGYWHLYKQQSVAAAAQHLHLDLPTANTLFAGACSKLLTARQQRLQPHRDDKILPSWNGLMIKGMAEAGRQLQEPHFITSAQRALDFIKTKLWQDKRLLASYKDGQARLMAYLDDYAFLLDAILSLLQAQWHTDDLHFAIELADALLEHFSDNQQGGFYFTAQDHEQLLLRPKLWQDETTPSGNGIAASALLKLGYLLSETRYLQAAENLLHAAWHDIQTLPLAHPSLLLALSDYLQPPSLLIIRGPAVELPAWQAAYSGIYAAKRLSFVIPNEAGELPGHLAEHRPGQKTSATLCRGQQCLAAITNVEQLKQLLHEENL